MNSILILLVSLIIPFSVLAQQQPGQFWEHMRRLREPQINEDHIRKARILKEHEAILKRSAEMDRLNEIRNRELENKAPVDKRQELLNELKRKFKIHLTDIFLPKYASDVPASITEIGVPIKSISPFYLVEAYNPAIEDEENSYLSLPLSMFGISEEKNLSAEGFSVEGKGLIEYLNKLQIPFDQKLNIFLPDGKTLKFSLSDINLIKVSRGGVKLTLPKKYFKDIQYRYGVVSLNNFSESAFKIHSPYYVVGRRGNWDNAVKTFLKDSNCLTEDSFLNQSAEKILNGEKNGKLNGVVCRGEVKESSSIRGWFFSSVLIMKYDFDVHSDSHSSNHIQLGGAEITNGVSRIEILKADNVSSDYFTVHHLLFSYELGDNEFGFVVTGGQMGSCPIVYFNRNGVWMKNTLACVPGGC